MHSTQQSTRESVFICCFKHKHAITHTQTCRARQHAYTCSNTKMIQLPLLDFSHHVDKVSMPLATRLEKSRIDYIFTNAWYSHHSRFCELSSFAANQYIIIFKALQQLTRLFKTNIGPQQIHRFERENTNTNNNCTHADGRERETHTHTHREREREMERERWRERERERERARERRTTTTTITTTIAAAAAAAAAAASAISDC